MFLLLIGLLLTANQQNVENRLLEQANLYINNLQAGIDLNENSWALIEIYQASCSQTNSVQRLVNRSTASLPKQLISSINCGDLKPTDELIQLIHSNQLYGIASSILIYNREHIDYELIRKSIVDTSLYQIPTDYLVLFGKITQQESIRLDDVPQFSTELILNAIFYSRNIKLYPPVSDLNLLLEQFRLEKPNESELKKSLQISNIVHYLYNSDRYIELSSLHNDILTDNIFPICELKVGYTNALAYAQNTIGRYDYSLELHREIIEPILTFYGLKNALDQSRLNQGASLYSLGKFAEARNLFENLFYDPNTNVDKASINNNLSISYFKLGEKNKYIRYLLNALEEAESGTEYLTYMTILSNLYFYYNSIGDHQTALSYIERARKSAIERNDVYQIASIHAITGMYYWKTENDVQKALEQLQLASLEFNPETNFFDYFRSQFNISDIYIELDSLDSAKMVLESLIELASQTSNSIAFIETTLGLLNIALIEDDLESAEDYLEVLSLYSLDNLDFNTLVKYNILVADFQFQSGDERLAYQNLRPVIDQVLDRARTSIDTQTGFWVQEDEYIDAFNALLNILITMGNEQEAVQLLDEIKTINDAALYNSPILRANRLTEGELARDQLLNSDIMNLRESFLYAIDSDSRQQIKNEIDQLSAEREEILNNIRQEGFIKKTPIWMIQQELDSEQQILHFTEVGDFLYISYISKSELNLKRIDFESPEKALFTNVADQIALSETNLVDLFEIYDFLGIDDKIEFSKSSIIVIPDNYLYRIPLEILPYTNPDSPTSYGSTTYLIEKFNIEYYASLQEYHSDTRVQRSNFDSDLSAFAISDFNNFEDAYLPNLPFATQEVRTISDKLISFGNKNVFMESEATKSAFLDEVSNARIVHIATHSEVSEQDPLFSTIYLNSLNSSSNMNALYAYELFDQRLNNELIMLNSCSSGSGDYLQGSGIMGITRALRYAGAKSMALNLWAVNDKIAFEFASVFYQSLDEGRSKSEAMRDAKINLLQNGNANPHFWGAFMLTGDPSPLTKRPDSAGLVFPILLVIIGSISMYLRRIYSI